MLNRKNALKSKYPFLGYNDRLSVDFSPLRPCYMNSADQSPSNRKSEKSLLNPLQNDQIGFCNQVCEKKGKVSIHSILLI